MAFTAEQEAGLLEMLAEKARLLAMLAEWQAGKDQQAQSLIDQKQTAEGQLRSLLPALTPEKAVQVETELAQDAAVAEPKG